MQSKRSLWTCRLQSHNRIQTLGRHGWPKVSLQPAHVWERLFSSSWANLSYRKQYALLRSTGVRVGGPECMVHQPHHWRACAPPAPRLRRLCLGLLTHLVAYLLILPCDKTKLDIERCRCSDRQVIGVETFCHPLHRVWNGQEVHTENRRSGEKYWWRFWIFGAAGGDVCGEQICGQALSEI